MTVISAQISLYPLRQKEIGPVIRQAVHVLRKSGLAVDFGEMSTIVWGEEHEVFAALQEVFGMAVEQGDAVMIVTLSNACPMPKA